MFNPFKKKYTKDDQSLFDFLKQIKHFEKLTDEELSLITPYMYERTYKQDEVVFFRGDPSYALYIMKDGNVSLNIDVKDKFEEFTIIKTGGIFGDNSILKDTKRIYSCIVISKKAEIYVIPQINLHDIMDSHLTIKTKIMTSFAELYDEYTSALFNIYKSSFGFFELGSVYNRKN